MKKYLIAIKHPLTGAVMSIGAQTDSTKPIYIYYCFHDTGSRYINIGSAARYLEKLTEIWGCDTIKIYGTAADTPVYGCSEWNKELFRRQYCKESFPNLNLL